ncbi:MAG: winged helix-turn-helix transcriptional regulator [Cyclobacteriaceae bacterium]|nr:winged helix-turn-helix transcriptional regulator [Cyclobacteriaceae bacterium]
MKSKLLLIFLLSGVILTFSAFMLLNSSSKDEFLEKRAALIIRKIGHELLLHGGDTTSRILPVQKLGENVFLLRFENQFSFMPDTLVTIVRSKLNQADLPLDYMVHVFDCKSNEVIYGFEIRPSANNIVPCLGRVQPNGCYNIQIAFTSLTKDKSSTSIYLYASLLALAGAGLFAFIFMKKQSPNDNISKTPINTTGISIGKYSFDQEKQLLTHQNESISLSYKEARLLTILSANLNSLVERDYLLKEIWENEGVITGRSLDVFVSKLRKKLSNDPEICITNVHGRGYKLELKSETV